jgi:hypothetical protein
MHPGEMNIDPIESEFFSTEALGSLADALVRESIQNSLDARVPGSKAHVRIAFPPHGNRVPKGKAQRYLAGLWPHLAADRSGVAELPSPEDPLTFLVVEDSGTRGLQGDPRQSEDEELGANPVRNDFYYFWRNVGRSRKAASDLGRWGLGKTVFPASSRLNAFFAVTTRRDDGRRLLMGQAVLRIHRLEGARFYPYGYFACFEGDFALPVSEAATIDEFCRDFGLRRPDGGASGLSVVIPYPDGELKAGEILSSVVRHYFLPILAGDLVVDVESEGRSELLDSGSLMRALGRLGTTEGASLQRLVELARWGIALPESRHVRIPTLPSQEAPRWAASEALDAALSVLREDFASGSPVAVHVPVWVKPSGGEPVAAGFDLYLERDDAISGSEEHFVRDGITVAGVRSGVTGGVRAIVRVRDRALSGLLGDSENPAHTEWQERSPRFKERYRHGPYTLRYVKGAPREIVRVLTRPAKGRDFTLLRNLFSLDVPTEEAVRKREAPPAAPAGPDGTGAATAIEPVGRDRHLELQKIQGGFRILGAVDGSRLPRFIAVAAAYEMRRGNPFTHYQPFDFRMDAAPIAAEASGATIVQQAANRIVLRIDEPAFQLTVRGFDPHRDVRVRTLAMEEDVRQ